MIALTRLGNNERFFLNPDLIERIDSHVDTVIRLTSGVEYVVADSGDEVVEKIIRFRTRINAAGPAITHAHHGEQPAGETRCDGTVAELSPSREVSR